MHQQRRWRTQQLPPGPAQPGAYCLSLCSEPNAALNPTLQAVVGADSCWNLHMLASCWRGSLASAHFVLMLPAEPVAAGAEVMPLVLTPCACPCVMPAAVSASSRAVACSGAARRALLWDAAQPVAPRQLASQEAATRAGRPWRQRGDCCRGWLYQGRHCQPRSSGSSSRRRLLVSAG